MGRLALLVLVLAACKKQAPRHEGPLRVTLGDCAEAAVWVSGPRPVDPAQRVTARLEPQPAAEAPDRGGAFASLTGTGDIASGFDDQNISGELSGGGGIGTGVGTLGTGRIGGGGYGIGRRRSNAPTTTVGQPATTGSLDKAIIRRYIKRHLAKLQACYEKQLVRKPQLAGTVQSQFTIKGDGTVTSATAQGMDPEVASCVASVLKQIEFPKPQDGGLVVVKYPFTFRPAGDAPATPPTTTPPAPAPVVKTYEAYQPGKTNPLAGERAALEDCLRGNDRPYGAATITFGGTPVVHGLSEDAATCVAELAAKLASATPRTCSFAFGAMPVAELPAVELTGSAIRFEGAQVADPKQLDDKLFKIDGLFERVEAAVKRDRGGSSPVSVQGPIVLRAPAATPIELVTRAALSIRAAGGDFVFGIADGAAWRTLPALELPIVPVPLGTGGWWEGGHSAPAAVATDRVTLSLLIQKDKLWVGVSRINEIVMIEGLDWNKLERALLDQRKTALFAERFDLEIAGEGSTYGDLIQALEVARKAGFVDLALVSPSALAAGPRL